MDSGALRAWAELESGQTRIFSRLDLSNICYNVDDMTATLKITSIGNSAGVILPKEVLEKLRVGKGDTLFLTETPLGFSVSALDEKVRRQMEVAEQVMRDNRNLLHKLAQ